MNFITVPLVVGMICAGIYGLFDLFVRKQERLRIIDRLGNNPDLSAIGSKMRVSSIIPKLSIPFSSLRAGCLLVGLGVGLLVGFLLTMHITNGDFESWRQQRLVETVFGASVLLFGGISLIASFLIEMKLSKDKE